MPSLEIEAIGAGGGSLARVDAFGALSVGPESAGSLPGPACYQRGGTGATVTDAHVVLARIDSAQVLGGTVPLNGDAARRAVAEAVAQPYGMSVEQAAEGIVTVANSNMTRLLWEMIIGRGRDPRDFSLRRAGRRRRPPCLRARRGARNEVRHRAVRTRRFLGLGHARRRHPPRLQPDDLRRAGRQRSRA